MRRNTDSDDRIHFFRKGDRISVVNGKWFITTREGEEGPFANREQAEEMLERLIARWKMAARAVNEQAVERCPEKHDAQIEISDRQVGINQALR